jgi:hypothetical protein
MKSEHLRVVFDDLFRCSYTLGAFRFYLKKSEMPTKRLMNANLSLEKALHGWQVGSHKAISSGGL